MDYIAFCRSYYGITHIPVSLLENGRAIFSALGETLSIDCEDVYDLFPLNHNPSFCSLSPEMEYGRIYIENTDYDLILGPIFRFAATEDTVRKCMKELMIPLSLKDAFQELLCHVPALSHTQFGKHLLFLFLVLNGREADIDDFYQDNSIEQAAWNGSIALNRISELENGTYHNTYYYEKMMLEKIKNGNSNALKAFFNDWKQIVPNEGRLADTPLRHAKNLFISSVTKIAFNGAIPGGMDIETVYQLTDHYIQECERLTTAEAVGNLMYAMELDFCRRVGESKIPDGISVDIYQAMNFIRTHVNEHVTLDDIAAHTHRSTSYIMKKFRQDLGIHVSAYITRCKLEEAKSMLAFTDKSLSEISSYLCFSSQSYFQNLFKKQYGITPLQYRKKNILR